MSIFNTVQDGCASIRDGYTSIKHRADATRRSINKFITDVSATASDNEAKYGMKRNYEEVEPEQGALTQSTTRKRMKMALRSQLIAKDQRVKNTATAKALTEDPNRAWIEGYTSPLPIATQAESAIPSLELLINQMAAQTPTPPPTPKVAAPCNFPEKEKASLFFEPSKPFSKLIETASDSIGSQDVGRYRKIMDECMEHEERKKRKIASAKASGKTPKEADKIYASVEKLSPLECSVQGSLLETTPHKTPEIRVERPQTKSPPITIVEQQSSPDESSTSMASMFTHVMNTFTANQAQMMSTFTDTQKKMMESIDKKIEATDAKIEATNSQIQVLAQSVTSSAVAPADMAAEIRQAVIDMLREIAPSMRPLQQEPQALPPTEASSVSGLGKPFTADEISYMLQQYAAAQQEFGELEANRQVREELVRLANDGYDVFSLIKNTAATSPSSSTQSNQVQPVDMDTAQYDLRSTDRAKRELVEAALMNERHQSAQKDRHNAYLATENRRANDEVRELKAQLQQIRNVQQTSLSMEANDGAQTPQNPAGTFDSAQKISIPFAQPINFPAIPPSDQHQIQEVASSSFRPRNWADRRSRIFCRYLKTPRGCRHGDECVYYHPELDGPLPDEGDAVPAPDSMPKPPGPFGGPTQSLDTISEHSLSKDLCEAMAEQLVSNPDNSGRPVTTPQGLAYYDQYLTQLLNGLLASAPTPQEEQQVCTELLGRVDWLIQAIQATTPECLAASGLSREAYQQHVQSIKTWAEALGRRDSADNKLPQWIFQCQMRLQKVAVKIGQGLAPRNCITRAPQALRRQQPMSSAQTAASIKAATIDSFRDAAPLSRGRRRDPQQNVNLLQQGFAPQTPTCPRHNGGQQHQSHGLFSGARNPAIAQLEQALQRDNGISVQGQAQRLPSNPFNNVSLANMGFDNGNQQSGNANNRSTRNNRNRRSRCNAVQEKVSHGPTYPGNEDEATMVELPPSPSQDVSDWEVQQNWLPGEKEETEVPL